MNYLTQRVAILIDEVNIYLTARELFGAVKVDFQTMLQQFNPREIVRVIVYCIETPENNVAAFQHNVQRLGLEVKSKPVKVFRNGKRKGDWDIGIALDAVRLASKVDVITLVTGDGDFEELVHYLKHEGVKVDLMAFQEQVSRELLRSVDEFIPIPNTMLLKKSA
jgi:uncharacterized LabA/DUF88 family protein